MKDLLEFIVKSIVSTPENVLIDEEDNSGITVFTIKVAKEDAGTIIGQQGKTIKAIRNLLFAVSKGKRFSLEVTEA